MGNICYRLESHWAGRKGTPICEAHPCPSEENKKSASIAISIFSHYHEHAIGKGNFFNSGLDWVVPLVSSRFDIIVRRVETFAKHVAALAS
jgi:hypothetical protein